MIAVIGCGNANRNDDGVGPAVVRMLRQRALETAVPELRLLDAGLDGMAVMFAARGCRTLVIVDACRWSSPPGAIFEVPGSELAQRHRPNFGLHDFRWDHALYAGRQLFKTQFPADVTVMLIEIESVELGIGLSPVVAAAAARVSDRVEALIHDRVGAGV